MNALIVKQGRVLAKSEPSRLGANPRFVISSLTEFPPRLVYKAYCDRGECENHINNLKNALAADRLSCSHFVATASTPLPTS